MSRPSWQHISIAFLFGLTLLLLFSGLAIESFPAELLSALAVVSFVITSLLLHSSIRGMRSRMARKTARFVEERSRLQGQQQALLKLATSAHRFQSDSSCAIQELLETAAATLSSEKSAFWVLEDGNCRLRCVNLYNRQLGAHSSGMVLTAQSHPKLFEALQTNRVIVINELATSEFAAEMGDLVRCGITSVIEAPVRLNGQLYGLVCVAHAGTPRRWTVDEQHFAGSIADMAAMLVQYAENNRIKQELEQKSRAIEVSMDGMAILDAAQKYAYVNKAHAEVYGYEDPKELIGQSWRVLYDEQELKLFDEEFMPYFQRTGRLRIETIGRKKNGERFPQEISLAALEGGGLICVVHDISAHKAIELRAEQMALFATLNPAPILRFDSAGTIVSANPAAADVFGLPEVAGVPLKSVILGARELDLRDCIENGSQLLCTSRVGERFFQFLFRGVQDLQFGHVYGNDITDLKHAHQRLIDSKRFLRRVIDSDPNLIWVKDAQGRFTLANQATADFYGTTVHDILWKTDADFLASADELTVFREREQSVLHTNAELPATEERCTNVAGDERLLQVTRRPLRLNPDGELHVLGVATDITETKQLQDELLHSQKMEAIGQLAGGIAHDFNNLLTGIIGCTGLLKMTNERNHDVYQAADTIEGAAHRAGQLTQKLLGFARKGKHQNVPVDIHLTIEETLLLLRRTFEKNITIIQHLKAPSSHILGDPTQVQQIVLNLAINARDAMSPEINGTNGGELRISTRLVSSRDLHLNDPDREIGNFLELSVQDTGCGMSDDVRERIFEPFFTTKPTGRGTGMGLAMVYGIVNNHDGFIRVESERGRGTTFRVYLPCLDSEAIASVRKAPQRTIAGHGQILVVDDHNIVRSITHKMLSSLGYGVVTARDGVEAVEFYREHAPDVDLVIIDMVMPRMGARDCFRELKRINPNVRAVLSTGYVNNHAVQDILNEGMCGFIQKPYQLGQLSEVVAAALTEEGASAMDQLQAS